MDFDKVTILTGESRINLVLDNSTSRVELEEFIKTNNLQVTEIHSEELNNKLKKKLKEIEENIKNRFYERAGACREHEWKLLSRYSNIEIKKGNTNSSCITDGTRFYLALNFKINKSTPKRE